jgi:hypothetical protein
MNRTHVVAGKSWEMRPKFDKETHTKEISTKHLDPGIALSVTDTSFVYDVAFVFNVTLIQGKCLE